MLCRKVQRGLGWSREFVGWVEGGGTSRAASGAPLPAARFPQCRLLPHLGLLGRHRPCAVAVAVAVLRRGWQQGVDDGGLALHHCRRNEHRSWLTEPPAARRLSLPKPHTRPSTVAAPRHQLNHETDRLKPIPKGGLTLHRHFLQLLKGIHTAGVLEHLRPGSLRRLELCGLIHGAAELARPHLQAGGQGEA